MMRRQQREGVISSFHVPMHEAFNEGITQHTCIVYIPIVRRIMALSIYTGIQIYTWQEVVLFCFVNALHTK